MDGHEFITAGGLNCPLALAFSLLCHARIQVDVNVNTPGQQRGK
jgi:hypothetical protein